MTAHEGVTPLKRGGGYGTHMFSRKAAFLLMMAHAHPLPDGLYLPGNQSPQPFTHASASLGSPPVRLPTSQRYYDGMSPQNRRLQLRNAGFRGSILPARRITPFLGNTAPVPETLRRPVTDENSPKTAEKRVLYGEDLPPSPVSILQEISNTARRRGNSPRLSLNQILEDSTATEGNCESLATSWLQEAKDKSPSPRVGTPSKMLKLREGSLNERTPPPLSSPLVKNIKSRRKPRISQSSTNFEATKYIDHLESELTSLHTKVDALTSPTAAKAQATKLRTLAAQVRSLRNELSGWEAKFDERVADEIHQRSVIEADLKIRIRRLEDEGEMKDIKITELERELESTSTKIKNADSLALTNLELERKNDFLTELLAISPTRFDSQSAVSSPGKLVWNQRTPRPRSMLPSVPPSSSDVRRASTSEFEMVSWHPRNFAKTTSIAESPEESQFPPTDGGFRESSQAAWHLRHSRSNESGSDASVFFGSIPSSSSRPTSLISTSSFDASLGFPASSLDESKSVNRQRRMRRFPSGSCSLKPLILPTATVGPSLPASAPLYRTSDTPTMDVSNVSIDPLFGFLSKAEFSSPIITPTQPARQRSVTAAQKESLTTNKGKPITKLDTQVTSESLENSVEMAAEAVVKEDDSDCLCGTAQSPKPKRRSLQMELEQARELLGMGDEALFMSPDVRDDFNRRQIVGVDPAVSTVNTGMSSENTPGNKVGSRRHSSSQITTATKQVETGTSQKVTSENKTSAPTTVINTRFGILAKLTGLIASLKQDPLILARRILKNAWMSGPSRFGGICWWFIGLLFGFHRRKRKQTADPQTDEEERTGNIARHHYCAEAGRAGRTKQCLENEYDGSDQANSPSTRPDYEEFTETLRSPALSPDTTSVHSSTSIQFPLQCKDCVEPTSRRNVRLWFKFSLAIVLAVGIAIKDGPGTLLVNIHPESHSVRESRQATTRDSDRSQESAAKRVTGRKVKKKEGMKKDSHGSQVNEVNEGVWGWDVTFAENLGPSDFENSR